MKNHESSEMYLETILILSMKNATVRSIDISEYMGFSKPSVSRAVGLLKNKSMINVDENGYITFTKEGKKTATKIYERHTLLEKLLIKIGVNSKTATDDACKIEHVISEETFIKMKEYMSKIDNEK